MTKTEILNEIKKNGYYMLEPSRWETDGNIIDELEISGIIKRGCKKPGINEDYAYELVRSNNARKK